MAGLAQSNGRLPILRSEATSIDMPSDEFFDSCRKAFKLFEENEKRSIDNMKLYIVTAGCYSDYHIVGAFESEEKAKLYVEANENDYFDEDMSYREYDTLDDRLMDINDTRKLYSVEFYVNPNTGEIVVNKLRSNRLIPGFKDGEFQEYGRWDKRRNMHVVVHGIHVLADYKEQALKIAQDKYAEYKAQKAEII